jgi:hypothetical protein
MKNCFSKFVMGGMAVASLFAQGCTTREMDASAGNAVRVVTYPVAAPLRFTAEAMPLSVQTGYVYWKPVPGTNTYTRVVTERPLTIEEQRAQGILPKE